MPLTTILGIKAGLKRAWELMGMRMHFQNSTDILTVVTSASDVREFMANRGGLRPRQMAASNEASLDDAESDD